MAASFAERLREIAHVALDMDGTIYKGGTLFTCSQPFLALMHELGIGVSFLTKAPWLIALRNHFQEKNRSSAGHFSVENIR